MKAFVSAFLMFVLALLLVPAIAGAMKKLQSYPVEKLPFSIAIVAE